MRRVALGLSLAGLWGCGGPPPEPTSPPVAVTALHYDYLTKLRLDVARVDVDSRWTPQDGRRHVEGQSPASPLQAMRAMGEERLLPVGGGGSGQFIIDDASLVRDGNQYRGHFAAHLALHGADGRSLGGAAAQVSGTQPQTGRTGDDLFTLTHSLMDAMNVELQYQLQQSHLLQPETPAAAALPTPVETQTLAPPPGVVQAAPIPLDPDAAPPAAVPAPVPPPMPADPAAPPPADPPVAAPIMSPPPTSLGTIPQSLLPPLSLEPDPP